MSIALYGRTLAPGFAFGKAIVVRAGQLAGHLHHIQEQQITAESKRIEQAQIRAEFTLQQFIDNVSHDLSPQLLEFLQSHQQLLRDRSITDSIAKTIQQKLLCAESALNIFQDEIGQKMENIEDSYLRSRKDDFDEVLQRIRTALSSDHKAHSPEKEDLTGQIVICNELRVAEVIQWHADGIAGILTQHGGPLSHATILARSLHLPVLTGIENITGLIFDEDELIIDAQRGTLVVGPDKKTKSWYQRKHKARLQQIKQLKRSKGSKAITRDTQKMSLGANAEREEDLTLATENKAEFIGLYRTEFLYLHQQHLPSEEQQYEIYKSAVTQLDGRVLTIRTLDLGADKIPTGLSFNSHPDLNPALGLRAIRFSLQEPDVFHSQIRAILRASEHGPLRILLPLLSRAEELFRARHQIEQIHRQLCRQGHKAPLPDIGGMIEVPAAAIIARVFAKHLDFLSIGTNDLIQYTLAVDRQDDQVSHLLDPVHPAILRLLSDVLETGKRHNTPVAMCGEMAGDIQFTRLLIGLGLKEFSMHPGLIPEVRGLITHSDSKRAHSYAMRILRSYNPTTIQQLLHELNEGLD